MAASVSFGSTDMSAIPPSTGSRRLAATLLFVLAALPLTTFGGLRELGEPELRKVHAQGFGELFAASDEHHDPTQWLQLFNPLFAWLDADVQIRGRSTLHTARHADGTLELRLAGSTEEIRFDNLRVRGAPLEQSFGSLAFEQVNFSGSSLRIRQLP